MGGQAGDHAGLLEGGALQGGKLEVGQPAPQA